MKEDVYGFVVLGLVLGIFFMVDVSAVTLTCALDVNASCASNTTILYIQNDSGGFENSHAQNFSEASYDNALCCSVDTGSLGRSCEQANVLKLSNTSNAHVQVANYSGTEYDVPACLSYVDPAGAFSNVSCSYVPGGSCSAGTHCVGSIASSEESDGNLTNAHVGSCGVYDLQVCCSITTTPGIGLINPGSGVSYTASTQAVTFQYNVTNSSEISNCSLFVDGSIVNDSVTASYSVNTSVGAVNEFKNSFTATGTAKTWNVHCIDSTNSTGIGINRTFTVTAPSTTTGGSGSSGGGGGGGGGGSSSGGGGGGGATLEILTITPDDLSISTVMDIPTTREIKIKNNVNENYEFTISVESSEGLEDVVSIKESLILPFQSEETLTLSVNPIRTGLITGKIVLVDGGFREEIPVVVNVRSNDFLFDTVIKVTEEDRKINLGDDLNVQVELDQVGPREKVDVFVTYVIKDFDGNIYLEDSETFFVLGEKDYTKDFLISDLGLPPGKYVIGMELSYPGAFATSSAQFEVVEGILDASGLSPIVIGAIIVGITGIGAIIWALARRRKHPTMRRHKL